MNTTLLGRVKNLKIDRLLFPLYAVTVLAALAHGQTFDGSGTAAIVIDYNSTFGGGAKVNVATVQTDANFTIDPTHLRLAYNHFSFASGGFDLLLSQNFTIGLGHTVPISLDIHVSPFSDTAQNVSPFNLTATTNGQYSITSGGANPLPFASFQLAGTYTITSPDTTKSGTFSLLQTDDDGNSRLSNFTLRTTSYPSSVELLGGGFGNYQVGFGDGPFGTQFGATVDGVNIGFDFEGLWLQSNSIVAVPEPTSIGLLVLGSSAVALVQFGRAIRRRRAPSDGSRR